MKQKDNNNSGSSSGTTKQPREKALENNYTPWFKQGIGGYEDTSLQYGDQNPFPLFQDQSEMEEQNCQEKEYKTGQYKVEPGDSIIGIANKYNISIDELLSLNNWTMKDSSKGILSAGGATFQLQPGWYILVPVEVDKGENGYETTTTTTTTETTTTKETKQTEVEESMVEMMNQPDATNSGGVDGLDNILFAVSMGKQGGDKAVQYFQMSNKGILRAAVNNDIPTDRIKDIMRSTGKVGTGLKVVGVLGNVASAGHTMYKISQDGMSVQYGADLVFNAIAFVPGWGWVVSGVYFGGQAIMESEGFKAMQQEWREKYPITGAPPHMIRHCFVEGTQVLMKDFSLCNIENIEVGDTVKTFNFRTSQLENNRVLKISAPIHNDLVTISFTNDIKNINTEDHPYYVKEKGWCSFKPELTFQRYGLEALQLKEGDICYYYKDGELLEIKIVEIIFLDIEVKTYNLTEIENSNNYFANGFLVHNESENLKNTSKVPLNKNGQRVMFKPLEIKE